MTAIALKLVDGLLEASSKYDVTAAVRYVAWVAFLL